MEELYSYEPADIEIYLKENGMVLKEKSLIAFTQPEGKILAVGNEAEEIARKKIEGVQVISPLRQGMIADYFAAVSMFQHMIKKIWGKKLLRRPHIVVCTPKGITEVEKKALEDALYQTGAKQLTIYEGVLQYFMEESRVYRVKQYSEYDIFIAIVKDEPEKYIAEELSSIIDYAVCQGISGTKVAKLLNAAEEKIRGEMEI